MTPQQARAYDFIRDELAAAGVAPSYQEIARYLGLASKGSAHRIVDRLIDEGKLVRGGAPGAARKLRLPDAPDLTVVPTEALQAELMRRGAAIGALSVRRVPMVGRIGATCAHDGCGTGVKPGMLYCREHWFAIPFGVQEALKRAHATRDVQAYSYAKVLADDAIALVERSGRPS